MISRLVALIVLLHCMAGALAAQFAAKRQVVLQVSNGGFIAFKSQASATDPQKPFDTQSLASIINSQALADENRVIHRVLTDAQEHVIFGYDLWVTSDPLTRKFSLAIFPAADSFRRSFLKEPTLKRPTELFSTFPTSTRPQTLDDGDAISLELMVNHETGVKIVDVVRVTFDRTLLFDTSPGVAPKDFTLDAVSLSVKNYELFIDGGLIGKGKSTVGCTGALLWFYVPDRGRFIFSLVPRDGYLFEKIGVLDGNRIEFTAGGQHYEWISNEPILPGENSWNLWVLQDPKYTPLFFNNPPASEEKPGVLEKLERAVKVNEPISTLTLHGQLPKIPETKKKPVVPVRVMVGGADSMDHLLPKSP